MEQPITGNSKEVSKMVRELSYGKMGILIKDSGRVVNIMALEYSNMLMETFIKVIGHMGLKMEKG
jgi:hypothetical protein